MTKPRLLPFRIALASRFPQLGDAWLLRIRHAAGSGEPDMRKDPAEQVYAAVYLDCIERNLPSATGLRILDAGCQAGRLAIPLARAGHHVTGFDISAVWLDRCRANAAGAGVAIDFVQGSIADLDDHFAAGSFDAVICAEVLYTVRDCTAALRSLARLMRPGATLFASHRTRHYMLATLARFRQWDDLDTVVRCDEGEILGGQYYSWFDADALRARYAAAGLQVERMQGIGVVSGMGADGMAAVLDADSLDAGSLARLLAVERTCSALYPDAARYRLIVAKPTPGSRP